MSDGIAIVGIGCRLPGGVDSPEAFWQLLVEGRDAVAQPSATRAAQGTALPGPGREGGYLDDLAGFDAAFFGVSGREAEVLDPQHRLLLEVSWEALEHAGLRPDALVGSQTALYAGMSYDDYQHGLPDRPEGGPQTNGHSVAPGRVSYLLGLHGPSVALDSACSSSLVAVHLAGQALREGDCDVALAGGVTALLGQRTTRAFDRLHMLSPTDRCHAFDAAADGFVRAEGCAIVVLKRLADAQRDGDRVLAVIRGTAVNQDGPSDGLAAPSAPAQAALYRQALARAGVGAEDVRMIEAHGTGTPVGDPTEFASLSTVYGAGTEPCALGSVKTNLGHLEPVSGVTGLVKAVLAVRHGVIPPTLHFTRWNPALGAEGSRFFVPTGPVPFDGERIAAVSSYGFSGTNAHVVLAAADPVPVGADGGGPYAVVLPAASAAVLPAAAGRLADWLSTSDAPLRDVAYTLARRRSAGRGRLGVVAGSRGELVRSLRAYAEGGLEPGVVSGSVGAGVTRRPVWVFSGQGAQWTGMGRGMLAEPAFAAALAELDPLIRAEAGFSVLDVIRTGAEVTGCGRIQPTLFAMQVALAAAWRSYGIEPAGVIGHSMGEVAAAVIAGALSTRDGAAVICRRSALLTRIAGAGAMATVELEPSALDLPDSVSVAVLGAPGTTVVAGDTAAVHRLVAGWDARGIPARPVAVDVASHSPQVDPLLPHLREALADLDPGKAEVRFFSTVADEPAFDAGYWCANLRNPVRFSAAVTAAAEEGHTVFVEVSPHPVVTHAVSGSLAGLVADPVVLPTLRRDADERTTFLLSAAAQHCAGVPVVWPGTGAVVDVPTILFDRRQHWVSAAPAVRGMLGAPAAVPGDDDRRVWTGEVGTAARPWLADHRVHGEPVLPGAAYTALALTAAAELFGPGPVSVSGVEFRELLRLGERTEVTTVVTASGRDRAECEVHARGEDGTWVRHATATLHRGGAGPGDPAGSPGDPAGGPVGAFGGSGGAPGDPAALYAALRARGIEHGPAFAGVLSIGQAPGEARAEVTVPADPADGLAVHPVLLDVGTQVLASLLPGRGMLLPVRVDRVELTGDPAAVRRCHARLDSAESGSATGTVTFLDADGAAIGRLAGVHLVVQEEAAEPVDRWFVEPSWEPTALPAGRRSGTVLVLDTGAGAPADATAAGAAGAGSWAGGLAAALRAAGAVVEVAAELPDEDHAAVVWASDGSARDRTGQLVELVTALSTRDTRLYVPTRGALPVHPGEVPDLDQAGLRGLLRVLAYEHPELRATQVDTDGDLAAVAAEVLADAPDDEVALRGGQRLAARLAYAPLTAGERATATTRPVQLATDGVRLDPTRPGDLDGLRLTAVDRRPPGPGEVEIRVRSAGLNFRDVLMTLGLLPADENAYRIGGECAGTVAAAGAGVDLAVGAEVLAVLLGADSAFGTYVTVAASAVARVPAGVDLVAAGGLPIAYLTAWYGLRDLARLQPGERVLIHSATGGTGLAAVAVARAVGAEVLATAGTPAKREHLRGMGIEHVFDSRSLDFAEQALAGTGGEGVDVVLNSLSGAAIRAGLRSLRPFGRFVELGMRDILADSALGMAPFRHNITLSSVDLIELLDRKPDEFARLLREVLDAVGAGTLPPLPHREFPITRAADAFRLMAGAGHVGKLVLTVPAAGTADAAAPVRSPVRRDGAYVVTGGLRGVGLETARWLATEGAAHVVLNGRSAPSPETEAVLAGLPARVTVVLGDVAEPGVAERLVAAAGPALRGVVHSAMVLDDAAVTNIDAGQLDRVWRPKVLGAQRLAAATAGAELDWTVLHSSIASLLGNPGQGAYAAANGWLDAFAAGRTARGLPTLAVNWGAWGETGVATDFAERGYETIPTAAGFAALRELLVHGRVRTGVVPGAPDSWIPASGRGSAFFAGLVAGTGTAGSGVLGDVAAAGSERERRAVLEEYAAGHIRAVLRLGDGTLDPQTPLRALGFDSLLSIELRTRLQTELGIRLASNFVWQHETLAALAAGLDEQLD